MSSISASPTYRLPDLVRFLPGGIVVVDAEGQPVDWNASAAWLLGWPAQPDIGYARALGDGPTRGWLERLRATAGLVRPTSVTMQHERDGERIVIRVTATRLPDAAGHLLLGIEDVTGEIQLSGRVEREREQLRTLLEGAPDATLVDCGGTIVFASTAACELMRASGSTELVGWSLLELVHADSRARVECRLARLAAPGDRLDFATHRFVAIDGQPIDIAFAATRIGEDGTTVVFLRDVASSNTLDTESD